MFPLAAVVVMVVVVSARRSASALAWSRRAARSGASLGFGAPLGAARRAASASARADGHRVAADDASYACSSSSTRRVASARRAASASASACRRRAAADDASACRRASSSSVVRRADARCHVILVIFIATIAIMTVRSRTMGRADKHARFSRLS